EALAVALSRASEPGSRFGGAPGHEQGEPRAAGSVPEPCQLALAGVGVGCVGEPRLAVAVAGLLAIDVSFPVRVRLRAGALLRHSQPPPRVERIEARRKRG